MNNRIIKFRVWDSNNKRWYILNAGHFVFHPHGGILDVSMAGLIFQQFTGLLDKNNKEIYEGDVLFCSAEQMCKNNTPIQYKSNCYGLVEYESPSFVLRDVAKMSPIHWNGCEIIGNIFETLELLKQ